MSHSFQVNFIFSMKSKAWFPDQASTATLPELLNIKQTVMWIISTSYWKVFQTWQKWSSWHSNTQFWHSSDLICTKIIRMVLYTLLDICALFISERSRLDMHRPDLQIDRENKHEEVTLVFILKWVAMQWGHKTLVPLQSIIWLQNKHLHNKLIYCSTTWDSKH